jgi:hypothetical protein
MRSRFHTPLILLLCAFLASPSYALRRKLGKPVRRLPPAATAGIARYEFNSVLGVTICRGSALDTGSKFGYGIFNGERFYIGPELAFSLYSPGSILKVLGSLWYELPLSKDEKLLLIGGAAIGPGFTTQLAHLATTTLVVLGELALAHELDDLVTIRGELRSGLFGGNFANLVGFNVSFRFY